MLSSDVDTFASPALTAWYVVNYIGPLTGTRSAAAHVDRFNRSESAALELFAPTYQVSLRRQGQTVMQSRPLTFHYMFVRGELAQVKQLCARPDNGFSLLISHAGTERYATVDDRTMQGFRIIARAYGNSLPFYSLADVDLQTGDLVEVINGDFPGLIGTYMPRPRSKSGSVVLRLIDNLGTMAIDVKASDVRVLRFAPGTTRPYDQIDAIMPHLYAALRTHRAQGAIDRRQATRLDIFCRRMDSVAIAAPRLAARLSAILASASHLLGRRDDYRRHRTAYDRRRPSLTSPWDLAQADLLIAAATADTPLLHATATLLTPHLTPATPSHRTLHTELNHHLAPN